MMPPIDDNIIHSVDGEDQQNVKSSNSRSASNMTLELPECLTSSMMFGSCRTKKCYSSSLHKKKQTQQHIVNSLKAWNLKLSPSSLLPVQDTVSKNERLPAKTGVRKSIMEEKIGSKFSCNLKKEKIRPPLTQKHEEREANKQKPLNKTANTVFKTEQNSQLINAQSLPTLEREQSYQSIYRKECAYQSESKTQKKNVHFPNSLSTISFTNQDDTIYASSTLSFTSESATKPISTSPTSTSALEVPISLSSFTAKGIQFKKHQPQSSARRSFNRSSNNSSPTFQTNEDIKHNVASSPHCASEKLRGKKTFKNVMLGLSPSVDNSYPIHAEDSNDLQQFPSILNNVSNNNMNSPYQRNDDLPPPYLDEVTYINGSQPSSHQTSFQKLNCKQPQQLHKKCMSNTATSVSPATHQYSLEFLRDVRLKMSMAGVGNEEPHDTKPRSSMVGDISLGFCDTSHHVNYGDTQNLTSLSALQQQKFQFNRLMLPQVSVQQHSSYTGSFDAPCAANEPGQHAMVVVTNSSSARLKNRQKQSPCYGVTNGKNGHISLLSSKSEQDSTLYSQHQGHHQCDQSQNQQMQRTEISSCHQNNNYQYKNRNNIGECTIQLKLNSPIIKEHGEEVKIVRKDGVNKSNFNYLYGKDKGDSIHINGNKLGNKVQYVGYNHRKNFHHHHRYHHRHHSGGDGHLYPKSHVPFLQQQRQQQQQLLQQHRQQQQQQQQQEEQQQLHNFQMHHHRHYNKQQHNLHRNLIHVYGHERDHQRTVSCPSAHEFSNVGLLHQDVKNAHSFQSVPPPGSERSKLHTSATATETYKGSLYNESFPIVEVSEESKSSTMINNDEDFDPSSWLCSVVRSVSVSCTIPSVTSYSESPTVIASNFTTNQVPSFVADSRINCKLDNSTHPADFQPEPPYNGFNTTMRDTVTVIDTSSSNSSSASLSLSVVPPNDFYALQSGQPKSRRYLRRNSLSSYNSSSIGSCSSNGSSSSSCTSISSNSSSNINSNSNSNTTANSNKNNNINNNNKSKNNNCTSSNSKSNCDSRSGSAKKNDSMQVVRSQFVTTANACGEPLLAGVGASSSDHLQYTTPVDVFFLRANNVEMKTAPVAHMLTAAGSNTDKCDILLSRTIWERFFFAQQTEAKYLKKMQLWRELYICIKKGFPKYSLYLVGSTITGFGADNSDVDMCLVSRSIPSEYDTRVEALFNLSLVKEHLIKHLASSNFTNFSLIQAKVPILRFEDTKNGIVIDLNFNNCVGIRNTHLLYCYSQMDWRVRPLVLAVKLWAQHHNINDAKNMTISSYSLVLMVIHFLQYGTNPPVLPCLHAFYPEKFMKVVDLQNIEMVERLQPYRTDNKQSLGELLLDFLEYYTKFKYERFAISVRTSSVIPIEECRLMKSYKNDPHHWKHLCIEEPFDFTNTARSVFDGSVFEEIKSVFAISWRMLQESKDFNCLFCEPLFTPVTSTLSQIS